MSSKLCGCPLPQYTDTIILLGGGWYSMPTGVLNGVESRCSVKLGTAFPWRSSTVWSGPALTTGASWLSAQPPWAVQVPLVSQGVPSGASASAGQVADEPVHVSAASHTRATGRQAVVLGAKTAAGQGHGA